MLCHGVPAIVVSKIRGHSSPSITLSIYTHATLDMQDQAASVMDEIVSPAAVVIPLRQPTGSGQRPDRLSHSRTWLLRCRSVVTSGSEEIHPEVSENPEDAKRDTQGCEQDESSGSMHAGRRKCNPSNNYTEEA